MQFPELNHPRRPPPLPPGCFCRRFTNLCRKPVFLMQSLSRLLQFGWLVWGGIWKNKSWPNQNTELQHIFKIISFNLYHGCFEIWKVLRWIHPKTQYLCDICMYHHSHRKIIISVSNRFHSLMDFLRSAPSKVPPLNWLYEQLWLFWTNLLLLLTGILTYVLAIHNFQKYSLCWGNTQRWMDSAETSRLSRNF